MARKQPTLPPTPEKAFLDAIWAAPDDDTPRLMYADWLMERGDPRGEFIRLQCEHARMSSGEATGAALLNRERELLDEHAEEWNASLPQLEGVQWVIGGEVFYHRGFPGAVHFADEEVFLRRADAVFTATPSIFALFYRVWDGLQLAVSPHLARLTSLEIDGQDDRIGDAWVRALAASRHVSRLRYLYLQDNSIGDRGAEELSRSPHLAGLELLFLLNNRIGDVGASALARSQHLARLQELDLGGNPVGPDGEAALRQRFRRSKWGSWLRRSPAA